MNLEDLGVYQVHTEEPDRIIEDNHYLQSSPAGAKYRFLLLHKLRREGAAMIGRPVARAEDDGDTLELTRFWTSEKTPKNTESWMLSQIRQKLPDEYDRLIAYSSRKENHSGSIYKADNWQLVKKETRKRDTGWEDSRDGRTNRDLEVKKKFEINL